MALLLDDGFADHPKIVAAGPVLALKHLGAMGWASRHRTGGHIPRGALRQLRITVSQAEKLQAIGLWDPTEDGWRIHDWDVWNGDAATAKRRRDAKAARQRRWREGRRERRDVDAGVDKSASTHASTGDASTSRAPELAQHIPSRPVPPRDGEGDGNGVGTEASSPPSALGGAAGEPPPDPDGLNGHQPEPLGADELAALVEAEPEGSPLREVLERRRLAERQREHAERRGAAP